MSELSCCICYDIATDAVITNCCKHIFCETCIARVSICPICRAKPLSIRIDQNIRSNCNSIPRKCNFPSCPVWFPKAEFEQHQKECKFRSFCCPLKCGFVGLKSHLWSHLIDSHEGSLDPNINIDLIATKINADGSLARLGSTGKFYCGQRKHACSCCDGRCGPTSGCNCKGCMQHDLVNRNLPTGYLVNNKGFASRRGTSGHFYCGRRVLVDNIRTDGYCGPTNGDNCTSCAILDQQSFRYIYE